MITKIEGKVVADELKSQIKAYIEETSKNYRKPSILVVTIGDNQASEVYVRNKKLACEYCGIEFNQQHFAETVTQEELDNYFTVKNNDNSIDGIIIQLPVPKNLNVEKYVTVIKDVDGFSPVSLVGAPCTPFGIMKLFDYYKIDLTGKHVVILGRSKIVGKPLIDLCLERNATVTSCNSYTKDLPNITEQADVIISAIGKSKMINYSYLSPKCTCIIDVGINRDENNKLCGDVDYEDIVKYWTTIDDCTPTQDQLHRYITPVPGGVGPMTVASLMEHIYQLYKIHKLVDDIN